MVVSDDWLGREVGWKGRGLRARCARHYRGTFLFDMTGVYDEHDWIQYMKACTLILERPSIKRYVRSVPGSKGELDLGFPEVDSSIIKIL